MASDPPTLISCISVLLVLLLSASLEPFPGGWYLKRLSGTFFCYLRDKYQHQYDLSQKTALVIEFVPTRQMNFKLNIVDRFPIIVWRFSRSKKNRVKKIAVSTPELRYRLFASGSKYCHSAQSGYCSKFENEERVYNSRVYLFFIAFSIFFPLAVELTISIKLILFLSSLELRGDRKN